MVAAAPGVGKSALVTTLAIRSGVRTVYESADSDRMTLGVRIGAHITRYTTEEIETSLAGVDRDRWYQAIEAATPHIWWAWDAAPTLEDIEAEIEAYAVCHGDWPELIVIDNLKNVWVDEAGGGDHVRFDRAIDFLHEVARDTGACVVFLHHVTGEYEDGIRPIPLSGLLGKVGKTPRLILTLYKVSENEMGVCIVKNSVGPANPSGQLQVKIPFVPERMWFGGVE